ncbi:MAG: T9SS type A sorting domain-containing protein [Cytophagaceae bacterium]
MSKSLSIFLLLFIFSSSAFSQSMCPLTTGTEKIVNGDFSSGNTGFTSTFTFFAGPGTLPGDQYAIGSNPNSYNTGYFKSMGDHTSGTGNMLIYDFNNNSVNDNLWTQNVSVTAGQTYFFSAWFANIAINNTAACGSCPGGSYITNSPQLQFQITGTPNFTSPVVYVDSITNNWNQYFTTYTPTSTGTITIKIVNLRPGSSSNDLALDDISFRDGCDKITNLNSIGQSSALPDTIYNCNVAFGYNLDPTLPGTYGYAWKMTPGSTLGTGSTYNVASAPADGTKYYLCYSYINGCPRKDSVIFKNTPVTVNLGSDKSICAPVSYTISSGVMTPPASIQWYRNGTAIGGATSSTYNATTTGTYSLTASRAGCTFNTTDVVVISSPSSSFAGSGTYCNTDNTSAFNVTSGTTQVKWYTVASGGTALNPGNTNASISPAYSATNTTTPGCASGLYAEDVSSYPGTLMSSIPTGNVMDNSHNSNDGGTMTMMEVNQSLTLTSFDFVFPSGWSTSGTFTFNIFANNPTIGPWCGSCSPNGRYGGPTGAPVYTTTTANLSIAATTVFTVNTNYTLAPGYYWFQLVSNSGQPFEYFSNTPSGYAGSSIYWTSPFIDNTGNNVMRAVSAIQGASPGTNNGNVQGAGAIYNMKFQVGSSNTCSRLWICASLVCTAPVSFLSFDANRSGQTNYLVWKTASESNSSFFNIQRSSDGINFQSVGKVAAAGNSSGVLAYSFEDHFTQHSTIYYRIEEVDVDGKKTLSPVKMIAAENSSAGLYVFPIPVKKGENVEFDFNNDIPETLTIEAFDNLGRIVQQSSVEAEVGLNKVQISTSGLASGAYYVKITGSTLKVAKIVVE